MAKRDELEAMTKAEIIKAYDLDQDPAKITKDTLIELALRAERKKPEEPAGDGFDAEMLILLLSECSITQMDGMGNVHAWSEPGKAHTLTLPRAPEAVRTSPGEWSDIMDGDARFVVDGHLALDGVFIQADQLKKIGR